MKEYSFTFEPLAEITTSSAATPSLIINLAANGSAVVKFNQKAKEVLGLKEANQKVSFVFKEAEKVLFVFNSTVNSFELPTKELSASSTVRLLKAETEKIKKCFELPTGKSLFNLVEIKANGIKAFELEAGELVVRERTAVQLAADKLNKERHTEFTAYAKIKGIQDNLVNFNAWLKDKESKAKK